MVRVYAVLIAQSMSTLAARRPDRIAARMPASAAATTNKTRPLSDRPRSSLPAEVLICLAGHKARRRACEPAAAGQRACGLSEVSEGKPLRVKWMVNASTTMPRRSRRIVRPRPIGGLLARW
jgi:hypothetical protein